MNPNKLTLIITFILLVPTLAFALTLEEYVSNLDTSYYDGTINITIFNDEMIDNNSNSINDTLIFNITTDNATSDTFTANIFFNDMTVPSLSDTRAISSSNPSFYMNISTFYLTEEKYTYFVRIYNQIGQIVYESRKINTSDYFNYETGTNLIQITDENLDNDFIRINLTINVTKNEVVNISVNLEYNNSVISATKEVTLTTPTQLVSIDFDNETIKSTHYNGMYNITSVIIEDKIIETEQLTSSYDYEDFAETSYIKNISSQTFDNNSNNLSEALQFNFTLNIKSVDTYTIESDLYDLDDNYITTIAKNETLSTGTQIIVTEVAGGDIYSTYYNGEFKLSFTKLSIGNNTKDIVYNAHTTNITYYTEFERPPLSDLAITMNASFSEADNKTNITINITNRGEIPAFNIFVDIFDDSAYENQSSVSYLDVNKSQIFNFIASNKTTNSIFTAITDFDNYVDESNESNNIIQNIEVSLSISSLKTLYADDTTVIFEFIILNDGNFQISDISWAFMPGDGYTIKVMLKEGRHQTVYIAPLEQKGGQELIRVFTYCGKPKKGSFEWALRTNTKIVQGALALWDEEGAERLVLLNCFFASEVTVPEMKAAVKELSHYGDWIEKKMTGLDDF